MRARILLALLLLALPVRAEPGVAVLLDSRKPEQAELAALAKKCLYTLIKLNQLSTLQFSLVTADFANPATSAEWKRDFAITGADLPALAFYTRNGNKMTVENLIRHYHNPLDASQQAFKLFGSSYPQLVRDTEIKSGVSLSTVPEGATVKMDGHVVGESHLDLPLAPGLHIMELTHPDCEPFDQTLTVSLGQVETLNVTLTPRPAQVALESKGPPAAVSLDGQALGTTPLTVNATAGVHRLTAHTPGCYDLEGEVRLAAGKPNQVVLTPSPQLVRVACVGIRATGYTSYSTRRSTRITLPEGDIGNRAPGAIAARPGLRLVNGACDCALALELRGSSGAITGVVHVIGGQGRDVQAFTASRDMPLLTFDEQGSAEKRAREVADELMTRALDWIPHGVQPSPHPPEGTPPGIQLLP